MFPNWDWTIIAVSTSFHSVAILSTIFRLWYKWHTGHMWLDDAWAAIAFLADVACLVATLLEKPIPNDGIPRFFTVGLWIISFAYPTLMWAARISILTAMVQVLNPEGKLRQISLGTGVFFGLMAIGLIAQRAQLCIIDKCLMDRTLLITQTTSEDSTPPLQVGIYHHWCIADCIADVLLTVLPIWSLRAMNLGRGRKILISSVFSASMVINVVTIVQAVALFRSLTSGSPIFEHVKVACAMIVCNLLVIVSFVYRILHKGKPSLEDSMPGWTEHLEFTTVDLAQPGLSQETSTGMSLSVLSGTTKSSTWSFRGGSRSKTFGSVTVPEILVETEEVCQ